MADKAVIFDVDGVLLELTRAEEELFFLPFERRYGLTGLSRDWNSYRIRNDEKIIDEIFETHGLPAAEKPALVEEYVQLLQRKLGRGEVSSPVIAGAGGLLQALAPQVALGIATANLLAAARLRLEAAGLWQYVRHHAFGAEGSCHKHETVARAMAALGLAGHDIAYIGDNLNDLEAGRRNGVNFIGYSADAARLLALQQAGAVHVLGNHTETLTTIKTLLSLD